MKRLLLLALTAGLLSPIGAKSNEFFTELEQVNPYSYLQPSLTRFLSNGKRYIRFKGTTKLHSCFTMHGHSNCRPNNWKRMIRDGDVVINKKNQAVWRYEVDCISRKFDRKDDQQDWINVRMDPTAELTSNKYCPLDNWNKLPLDSTK